jgi:hypothetical protein
MEEHSTPYRYKLDFYYQQSIMYLITLIVYAGVRGTFSTDGFTVVWRDPILYIILVFVLMSFVALILNLIRDRKLLIEADALVFKNRFHEMRVDYTSIEWMVIGRERHVQTGGRFQVVVIKLKHRRRTLRIRVGRYERDRELIAEMHRIASKLPKGHLRRFGLH